jgi:hypothetical protein
VRRTRPPSPHPVGRLSLAAGAHPSRPGGADRESRTRRHLPPRGAGAAGRKRGTAPTPRAPGQPRPGARDDVPEPAAVKTFPCPLDTVPLNGGRMTSRASGRGVVLMAHGGRPPAIGVVVSQYPPLAHHHRDRRDDLPPARDCARAPGPRGRSFMWTASRVGQSARSGQPGQGGQPGQRGPVSRGRRGAARRPLTRRAALRPRRPWGWGGPSDGDSKGSQPSVMKLRVPWRWIRFLPSLT